MQCRQDTFPSNYPQTGEQSQLQRLSPWSCGPSPTSGSPAWGSHIGKINPQMSGFEGQWNLPIGEMEGSRKQRLLLKGACKISHTLRPSTEAVIWKDPGSDLLAGLRKPLREAGGNWGSPWRSRHWWQPFGELIISWRHWCWQVRFWNPPCSLFLPGLTS